jgi:hypothetical protein
MSNPWQNLLSELETKFFLHYYSALKDMTYTPMKWMASLFAGMNETAGYGCTPLEILVGHQTPARIILGPNHAAEQRGNISNEVNRRKR